MYRKLIDWEWYNDPNTLRLFIHLLLKANHKSKNWKGTEIKKGELITGRKVLSKDLFLSEQQIRTSLNKLKSTNNITIKTTNQYSIISIVLWKEYQQDNQQVNKQATNEQPIDNHKQECKEYKNEKKKGSSRFKPPQVEMIIMYFQEKGITGTKGEMEANKFFDFYEAKGWMVGKNKMKDWKAAVRNWIRGIDRYYKTKKIDNEPDTDVELSEEQIEEKMQIEREKVKKRDEESERKRKNEM